MNQDDFNSHYTVTTRISGGDRDGWDFSCESCGYHARYLLGDGKTQYTLEILDAGDPFTRHLGPYAAAASLDPCADMAQATDGYIEPEQDEPDEGIVRRGRLADPRDPQKAGIDPRPAG